MSATQPFRVRAGAGESAPRGDEFTFACFRARDRWRFHAFWPVESGSTYASMRDECRYAYSRFDPHLDGGDRQ